MAYSRVQAAENHSNNSFRAGTPISLSKSFDSDNTSGNTILVIVGAESGNVSISKIDGVIDSNGNGGIGGYTEVVHHDDATNQGPGLAIFYAKNVAGGSNTVTASWNTDWNGFGAYTTNWGLWMIIVEMAGLGASPSIQDFKLEPGDAVFNHTLHITDSLGNPLTLEWDSANDYNTVAVVDIAGNGIDHIFACGISIGNAGDETVTLTPPGGPMALTIAGRQAVGFSPSGMYLALYDSPGTPSTLAVACGSPPDGTVGTSYEHAFPASGGTPPYTFSVLADTLPPGLSIDPLTGIVSGIPTLSGTFPFVVDVADSAAGTASVACSITIGGMTLGCGSSANGTVGVAYVDQLVVSSGVPPYVFALLSGTLPPGLTLNPATGEITGTPTTPGAYCFTVQVTEGAPPPGTGGFVLQVTVNVVHGLNSTSVSPGVWDDSGNVIKFGTVKLTDPNTAVLTFPTPQSGSFKLSSDTFQQGFVGQTSVNVPHGLNSLNLIPVVYDGANNVIDFGTFELVDANNALLTFAEAQDGNLVILLPTGTYSQTFAPASNIPVPHNLNSTLLRVAVYDTSDNLIAYESFGPVDANNSVLTFPAGTPQAGRVVVRVP